MTKKTTKKTSTKVSVIETMPVIKFDVTKAAMTKLKKQCAVFKKPPDTPADYSKLTKQIALVRTTRTSIEHRRKELKAPLLAFGKEVDGQAKTLATQLQEMETPLVNLKMKADAVKATEKLAKERAEQQRLEALNAKLGEIREGLTMAHTPGAVTRAIEDLEEMIIDADTFQEMAAVAEVARQETLMKLRQLHSSLETQRIADENRQQELADLETQREAQAKVEAEQRAQREAMEAQQAELDAQQAELDTKAREAQEAADAVAQAAQDKIDQEAREKAEKEAAARLKKEAATQARKQAKWKKEVLADVPALEAYLANLAEVVPPVEQMHTNEGQAILADTRVMIDEAQLQVSGLRTLGESDD